MLDLEGLKAMISALADGHDGEPLATIERLWRASHPRTGEVLVTIGAHHPDKRVAKAAKKAAFKFNSRAR